jgi:hypothetical protein
VRRFCEELSFRAEKEVVEAQHPGPLKHQGRKAKAALIRFRPKRSLHALASVAQNFEAEAMLKAQPRATEAQALPNRLNILPLFSSDERNARFLLLHAICRHSPQ